MSASGLEYLEFLWSLPPLEIQYAQEQVQQYESSLLLRRIVARLFNQETYPKEAHSLLKRYRQQCEVDKIIFASLERQLQALDEREEVIKATADQAQETKQRLKQGEEIVVHSLLRWGTSDTAIFNLGELLFSELTGVNTPIKAHIAPQGPEHRERNIRAKVHGAPPFWESERKIIHAYSEHQEYEAGEPLGVIQDEEYYEEIGYSYRPATTYGSDYDMRLIIMRNHPRGYPTTALLVVAPIDTNPRDLAQAGLWKFNQDGHY